MIEDIAQFYSAGDLVLPAFERFFETYALREIAKVDHICYKCADSLTFEKMRGILEENWLHQSIISQRRIAIVHLEPAFDTSLGPIRYLELSDQKPNGEQQNGFDHVEIYSQSTDLVSYLQQRGVTIEKVERPHHTTHDIAIESGLLVRITAEPLVNKIKRDEMK